MVSHLLLIYNMVPSVALVGSNHILTRKVMSGVRYHLSQFTGSLLPVKVDQFLDPKLFMSTLLKNPYDLLIVSFYKNKVSSIGKLHQLNKFAPQSRILIVGNEIEDHCRRLCHSYNNFLAFGYMEETRDFAPVLKKLMFDEHPKFRKHLRKSQSGDAKIVFLDETYQAEFENISKQGALIRVRKKSMFSYLSKSINGLVGRNIDANTSEIDSLILKKGDHLTLEYESNLRKIRIICSVRWTFNSQNDHLLGLQFIAEK